MIQDTPLPKGGNERRAARLAARRPDLAEQVRARHPPLSRRLAAAGRSPATSRQISRRSPGGTTAPPYRADARTAPPQAGGGVEQMLGGQVVGANGRDPGHFLGRHLPERITALTKSQAWVTAHHCGHSPSKSPAHSVPRPPAFLASAAALTFFGTASAQGMAIRQCSNGSLVAPGGRDDSRIVHNGQQVGQGCCCGALTSEH